MSKGVWVGRTAVVLKGYWCPRGLQEGIGSQDLGSYLCKGA